jgi:hypothetical protein
MIKIMHFMTGLFLFLLLGFLSLTSFFFTGGCARGPFPTEVPSPTPTFPVTPTDTPNPAFTPTPTPIPVKVLDMNFQMNGTININKGFYIFAFNRPAPGQSVANPISINDTFWTDYISLGLNQSSNFVRRERITPGDSTTNWNPTLFTFTTGSFSGNNIQVVIPLSTFNNPQDLYFNMITTDSGGVARDALGFGTGTFSDSYRIDLNKLGIAQTLNDVQNDVVTTPPPPDGFLPVSTSYDITTGQITVKLQ